MSEDERGGSGVAETKGAHDRLWRFECRIPTVGYPPPSLYELCLRGHVRRLCAVRVHGSIGADLLWVIPQSMHGAAPD